jgi:hypothetical protein
MIIERFLAEYSKEKNWSPEDWAVVSEMAQDGVISEKAARNYLIKKEYERSHQRVGCTLMKKRLGRQYGISYRMVREVVEGV